VLSLTSTTSPPAAVLIDRDGTLVVDVPYNRDPDRVNALPGVPAGLARLRAVGIPTAVVTNQSGVARGLLSLHDVDAVNARLTAVLGPLGPFVLCPHGPADRCRCRKPEPGLVLTAALVLGIPAEQCAVIGDIGADVQAALAAGARPVLVPTAATRPEEIRAAPEVAATFADAVELLLGPP
jgi:D-glycero-D-manno-heptose 1,7-bisphosphate phosphatase